MNEYRSAAKHSHRAKLKSMGFASGGQVTDFPIRAPVIADLPSAYPSVLKAGRLATGGSVPSTNVIHGKAAEREMARMERKAKLDRGRHPKKD